MSSQAITLRPLTTADLATVTPWFDDPDTRRYLGGPDWPRQMLTLGQTQLGAVFRGARQTAAHRWLAEHDGLAVGYLDCGTFDRWTTCTQAPDQHVVVIDTIDRPSASICYTVAPQHRHHGIAQAMIRAMLADPGLDHIRIMGAGVEPANTASVRTLLAVGFQPHTDEPDWEDIIYFLLDRDSPIVRIAPAPTLPGVPSVSEPRGPSSAGIFGVLGVAPIAVLCCAGPALLAGGARSGIGGVRRNPWLITIGALVVGAVGYRTARHIRARRGTRAVDCCRPPTRTEPAPDGRSAQDHDPRRPAADD